MFFWAHVAVKSDAKQIGVSDTPDFGHHFAPQNVRNRHYLDYCWVSKLVPNFGGVGALGFAEPLLIYDYMEYGWMKPWIHEYMDPCTHECMHPSIHDSMNANP